MTKPHIHESHPDIVKRLKRADGHLRRVVEMIEGGRTCLDIAQQLHAVEKAIAQAKRALIQDHIDHCLEHAAGAKSESARGQVTWAPIKEFKAIAKYL